MKTSRTISFISSSSSRSGRRGRRFRHHVAVRFGRGLALVALSASACSSFWAWGYTRMSKRLAPGRKTCVIFRKQSWPAWARALKAVVMVTDALALRTPLSLLSIASVSTSGKGFSLLS